MRLLSLDISNFRVIRKATLPLPDRVIGVIGPNGAGKSSLVEAIAWVLYGNQAARSGKDEIKSQFAGVGENCEVTLDFEVNDVPYRVVRRLVGRTERAGVQLYRGGSSESVGVSETQGYISQLLGLDLKGFLTSFLARQQELNTLSDLQPHKRRDHLAGMLGIERLDRGISRLKDDLRLDKAQIEIMEHQLGNREGLKISIEHLSGRLGQLSSREPAVRSAVQEAETFIKHLSDKLAKLQETKSIWMQMTGQIDAARKTKLALEQRWGRLQKEASDLGLIKTEVERLEQSVITLPEVRQELERLKEARSQADLRSELEKQLETARKTLKEISEAAESGHRRLSAVKETLGTVPADISEQLKQVQRHLEEARNVFSQLKATRDNLADQVEKLTDQIAQVDEFGPDSVCDRCHRKLGDDLTQIRRHLLSELDQLKQKVRQCDLKLIKQKETGGTLRVTVSEHEQKAKTRYRAEVDKAAIDKELAGLMSRRNKLQETIGKLSEQLSESTGTAFDPRAFLQLSEQLAELEKARSRRQVLSGKLQRLPVVTEERGEIEAKLTELSDSLLQLERQVSELNFDEQATKQAQTELADSQQTFDKDRSEQFALEKEIEIVRTELDEKLKQKKELEKQEAELDERRTSRYHREKLGNLMTDFRQHLIARIRPRLADLSSGLFSDMTGGKYSFVELDEKYNLRVMDSGQFFGVERFSGGEKDLANLCLRLAISLALTESAGLSRSFVILDEVFGSQDTERKELIIGALGSLKNRFPQLLLITHVEDIRDRVEELIEVRPTSQGYSEVIVNEVAVG